MPRRSLLAAGALIGVLFASPVQAERNRRTAQRLAIAGTTVSSALIVASTLFAEGERPVHAPLFITGLATSIVTPSLGHFYAAEYVTLGMGVRFLAAGAVTYAVFNQTESQSCGVQGAYCESLTQEAVVLIGIASIAYIGGMAYDVYDAPDAVDRHHRSHGLYVNAATTRAPFAVVGLQGQF